MPRWVKIPYNPYPSIRPTFYTLAKKKKRQFHLILKARCEALVWLREVLLVAKLMNKSKRVMLARDMHQHLVTLFNKSMIIKILINDN